MLSNEEVKLLYGETVVTSQSGNFTLVHMDKPSEELLTKRTAEFNPASFFDCDCPLCRLQLEGGVVVFDDSILEDEETANAN